jgi:hypothetical protein
LDSNDFFRIFKATTPTRKVKIKTGIKLSVKEKSFKPRMTAPMVAGINRGDKPIKRPAIIVVPDRETPGRRAMH